MKSDFFFIVVKCVGEILLNIEFFFNLEYFFIRVEEKLNNCIIE